MNTDSHNNGMTSQRRGGRESNSLVRGCLQEALLLMMGERSYKDISVSELCRHAGVSRMAFYRNYRVINDLVHEAAVELNRKLLAEVGSPFREGTTAEWYTKVFRNIQQHNRVTSIVLQEDFQYEWMKIVNELALHDPSFTQETRYQRLCWCGGFENVVAIWLNGGMKETPEEMADYCVRYLPHTVIHTDL